MSAVLDNDQAISLCTQESVRLAILEELLEAHNSEAGSNKEVHIERLVRGVVQEPALTKVLTALQDLLPLMRVIECGQDFELRLPTGWVSVPDQWFGLKPEALDEVRVELFPQGLPPPSGQFWS